ncbi:hypothetical protein C8034_v002193 [Colletotrichum sidae]|uniref:Uncharacterized protein n=2 Tax=Colletotrichum orbiculare species complex TaxID=2707354 RepID=A0A4R8QBU4_9PEZI|nr:hypothetical protein C8035_v010871 [Colletotrichum spinosum]TEA15725.1 hypothetical protein C8034_v002193 [Colletotrichum sidae]
MDSSANQTWGEIMSGATRRSNGAASSTLMPSSTTIKGWLVCVVLSLLNNLIDRVTRYQPKTAEQIARDERRRRRLGAWEKRYHDLERLHEMFAELDIPEIDNTVDVHEWLDLAFWRT